MPRKELNLILHCGANAADLDQVKEVDTPQSEGRWQPISHWYLIDQLMKRLPAFDLQVTAQAHGLYHNSKQGNPGDRYFGMFQVEPTNIADQSDDFGVVFGLRNSHDKSFAAGLCCGSGVFVCDNLAFSAEIVLARRHTTHIMDALPNLVNSAVGRLLEARANQETRIEAYKETTINDDQAARMVVDMARNGAITKTKILDVVDEWENPTHEEFAPKTVWSLFNDTTEILKTTSLTTLPDRTRNLHSLCDKACGIVLDAKAAVAA